jgi:hypothetical protein
MNITIKGIKANRNQIELGEISVACSETETLDSNQAMMEVLQNPAVQTILQKFAAQVSFAPRAQKQQDRQQQKQQSSDGHLKSIF